MQRRNADPGGSNRASCQDQPYVEHKCYQPAAAYRTQRRPAAHRRARSEQPGESRTNPPCSQTATGNGSTPTTAPNVYLSPLVSANLVEWNGVPIDAPGRVGIRVVRLTNVRANANQLGLNGQLGTTPITGFVQITGNPAITVTNPQQTLATAVPGLGFGVLPGSFQFCGGFNGNQIFSESTPGVPGPAAAHLIGSELFPFAFKPLGTTTPYVPGQVYNSESGLTIPLPGNRCRLNSGTTIQGFLGKRSAGRPSADPAQRSLAEQLQLEPGHGGCRANRHYLR